MRNVDVAIIGAGSAGLSARREVAKVTDNYVIIDDGPMGTTCARVGCMPSKVLIQVANDYHRRHKLEEMGILGGADLRLDSKKAMDHVRKLRDRFVRGVLGDIESWRHTHLIQKRARIKDHNTLDLGDETVVAKKIILAPGSSPIVPEAWKPYQKYLINTDTFFELEDLPDTVAIIGLGVIGIELGQALSRLGVNVQAFSANHSIGGLTDPALQDYVAQKMSEEFPIHYGRSNIVGEDNGKILVESNGDTRSFDRAFLTMGRSPNIGQLDLARLNIPVNPRGVPSFDPDTLRIPETPFYVAGDSTGDRAILHEAADEGRIAGYNSVRDEDQCFQRRASLGITFSDPNIATLGQTHQQLVDAEEDFVTGAVSYEGQGRAIVKLKEKGLVHIYAHKKTGKLLGAEIFAPEGEHLAHLLSWMVALDQTVDQIIALPFYHPVVEEGVRTALRKLSQQIEASKAPMEVRVCS